jgi:hypothetical protein
MFSYYSRNKQNNIKKLGDFKQIKNVLQQEPEFGYTGSQIRKLKRRLVLRNVIQLINFSFENCFCNNIQKIALRIFFRLI